MVGQPDAISSIWVKSQLSYKPPRHEKNAGAEHDCEQHSKQRADHCAVPKARIGTVQAMRASE